MATATEQPGVDQQKNSALRKCFLALVERKQVNIDMRILKLMLKYELQVHMESIDEPLANVLPFMLVVYIRNWPGWQKSRDYFSGKLKFREWFAKFRQYIIVKLNFLIKNAYKEAMDSITAERREAENIRVSEQNRTERGTQTDFLAPKSVSPFTITIQGPPKMLCSSVFFDKGDDVILSQHLEPNWMDISIQELLNWPHVGVEFISTELQFKRYNRSEYIRFINLTNCYTNIEKNDFIEEIKIVDPLLLQTPYSLNVLWSYASQFMEILWDLDNIDQSRLEVVEAVLEEFLKDANDWQLNNTVATNTSVLFNIGQCTFSRKKKLGRGATNALTGNKTEIGYRETFIPKMETTLTYFNTVQDLNTVGVTYKHLNAIKQRLKDGKITAEAQVPIVTFLCLFCDIKFQSHVDLMKHLENEHGTEPNFVCSKCLRSLTIISLAKIRWKHVCVSRT